MPKGPLFYRDIGGGFTNLEEFREPFARSFDLDAHEFQAVGDNSTDNTAQLNALFQAAYHATGPVKVRLPAGIYRHSGKLFWPYPARIVGDGARSTILRFTGTGEAHGFLNPLVAEQREFMEIGQFNLDYAGSAVDNLTAFNLKGLSSSWVHDILMTGWVGNNSKGLVLDGSYGGTIGSFWNVIERISNDASPIGTGILLTGTNANGQSNENIVRDSRITHFSVCGVNIDIGDHVTVERCDLTSPDIGAVGIIVNDVIAQIIRCRFETNDTSIVIKKTNSAPDSTVIDGCDFSSNNLAIDIQANIIGKTYIRNNHFTGGTLVGVKVDTSSQTPILENNSFKGTAAVQIVDASTSQAPQSLENLFPIYFIRDNITAGLAGPQINAAGSTVAFVYVDRPYVIRGITTRLSAAATAGTLTIKATISTNPCVLAPIVYAGSGSNGKSWQGIANDFGTGGSAIGVQITTDAGWLPITDDLIVAVWVQFTDNL